MTSRHRIDDYLATQRPYLADGGLETTLIFHDGLDLPHFAAFTLLDSEGGRTALARYFERYLGIARDEGRGFVLDTATWRANAAWGERMGLAADQIAQANRAAVAFAEALRARHEAPGLPIVLNGVIGPSGDGYALEAALSPEEAEAIHAPQIGELAAAGADMATAVTMTHAGEAAGVVRAAAAAGLPVAVSFTVETDGRLPSGQALPEAIAEVDGLTGAAPVYYMVNCAHPDHFAGALAAGEVWLERLGGLRANASRLSHAELDEAEDLDEGDPEEFGHLHAALIERLPALRVLGGCCGTDHRHVSCVAHGLRAA
jgi:S-methylmethionine-dependent homocysteine/selenocysteine methylase